MKRLIFTLLLLATSLFSICALGTEEMIENKAIVEFTDSLNRVVSIPEDVDCIAPSGNVAQMALYAIAPEKLAGWSSSLGTEAKKMFLSIVQDKPVFGTFYGKKSNLNKEALMASNAELVIDVGNIKGSIDNMAAELDELSKTIALPVIFLSGEIDEYPMVFETLGTITGNEERAAKLKSFAEDALSYATNLNEEYKGTISVYYSPSDDGLEAVEKGSSHSEIIDLVGAENVVPATFSSTNGQINLESLYKWDPDVIILASSEAYERVTADSAWAPLKAVQNNRVYLMASEPYPLIDRPTSTQRLLGIYYLGKILFNDDIDIVEKTKEFYDLFYHYEITDEEAIRLLNL